MHLPSKEQVATVGTITGIVGAFFPILKGGILYAAEQSLKRKLRRAVAGADIALNRLAQVEAGRILTVQLSELAEYRLQLMDELQLHLKALKEAREVQQRREQRRYQEPTGWRKWFLFYMPEGVDGWIAHSLVYICLAIVGSSLVVTVRAWFQRDWDLLRLSPILFLYAAGAVYFAQVSFRLRHVTCLLNRDSLNDPIASLPLAQKLLVWFTLSRPTDQNRNGWFSKASLNFPDSLRGLYYSCLGTVFLVLILAVRLNEKKQLDRVGLVLVVALIVFGLAVAEVVRADLLARRALELLPSRKAAADHAQAGA